MDAKRKITVHVGGDLLKRAQRATGATISGTVRKGLELLAATEVYDGLLKMRGKLKLSIDLNELRNDKTRNPESRARRIAR
jgi:hypothetical protein